MLFYKSRSSFPKGLAVGIVAGAAIGAMTVLVCDEERIKNIKRFAKNGWISVSKKF